MNKKIIFSVATIILGLVCFIWAISYIGVDQILNQFSKIKPYYVLIYLAVSICIVLVLIMKWSLILDALGYRINFFNLLMYRQMGYSVGYVVPAFYIGGETVKSYFLNKKHKVPISDAVSSCIIDRAIELPMNFLLATVMFFIIISTIKLPLYLFIIMGIAILFLFALSAAFYYKMYAKEYFFTYIFDKLRLGRFKKLAPMRKEIMKTEEILIRFFNHKFKYVIFAFLMSAALWFFMMLEFWTGMKIVSFDASLVQIFLVIVMTGVSMTIPIPASIGVMELGQIGICLMVGIPAPVAVALSLLVRTRDLLWILSGLGYYLYSGTDYVKMLLKDENLKDPDALPPKRRK
jgi:uncharacterized protein (TIRG00374 family)